MPRLTVVGQKIFLDGVQVKDVRSARINMDVDSLVTMDLEVIATEEVTFIAPDSQVHVDLVLPEGHRMIDVTTQNERGGRKYLVLPPESYVSSREVDAYLHGRREARVEVAEAYRRGHQAAINLAQVQAADAAKEHEAQLVRERAASFERGRQSFNVWIMNELRKASNKWWR